LAAATTDVDGHDDSDATQTLLLALLPQARSLPFPTLLTLPNTQKAAAAARLLIPLFSLAWKWAKNARRRPLPPLPPSFWIYLCLTTTLLSSLAQKTQTLLEICGLLKGKEDGMCMNYLANLWPTNSYGESRYSKTKKRKRC